MTSAAWYTLTSTETLEKLTTDERGLQEAEAAARLKQWGPNILLDIKPPGLARLFARQFQSSLIYLLLGSGVVMVIIGEAVDAVIVSVVLLFNAMIGTVQEGRAQNTLSALRHFTRTRAVVRRAGGERDIADSQVVIGDIILLQAGEKVPADARVISSNRLAVSEAALTGESEAVIKQIEPIKRRGLSPSDQRNMIFKGTYVLSGNGVAVVVATGVETAIGRISETLRVTETPMPLQQSIKGLSRIILVAVVVIDALLFFFGLGTGRGVAEMIAVVATLSVSIIPEGLIVVLTIVLASGVWRMSKQNALVRRLQAVEALGQAQVIAVDKTGTITRNEMMVETLSVDGHDFRVSGNGYEASGEISLADQVVEPLNHPEVIMSAKAAALVATAKLWQDKEKGVWQLIGDPTEAALAVFAKKVGFIRDELEQETPRLLEVPFDHRRQFSAVWYREGRQTRVIMTGAPEAILNLVKRVWSGGRSQALSRTKRAELEEKIEALSRRGLRVLAFALGTAAEPTLEPEKLTALCFGGFFGISDAIRPEVAGALERARGAGIKVVMITGDHRATAKAVAEVVGIYKHGDKILTGAEINNMSDRELADNLSSVTVFARVTPEHKLRIIQAYKYNKIIVAMTGDGVNDAPSLVAADLGVAMGKIGTEVAKEAADIVLLDDNFGSIVAAVEEGRGIYQTIRKVILYLFSTNIGEVICIGGAILLGWPLPILPGQIIWLNLITDGFLDVALATDPRDPHLLEQGRFKQRKYIVDWAMARRMTLMAGVMGLGALVLFSTYLDFNPAKATTITLTVLAVYQWFNVWNCRSDKQSIFRSRLGNNWYLIGATALVIVLQLLAIYQPLMQGLLRTTALNLVDWILIISVAVSIILVEEGRKWLARLAESRLARRMVPNVLF